MNLKEWIKHAEEILKDRTIVEVRWMSKREMDAQGWSRRSVVLELDNGTCLYCSSDDEGNEAGTLFGYNPKKDKDYTFPVLRGDHK